MHRRPVGADQLSQQPVASWLPPPVFPALRQRPQHVANQQRQYRLPETQTEHPNRQDAGKDGRELQVRRRPGPQQLQRSAVPIAGRDVLNATRFDGRNPIALGTRPDGFPGHRADRLGGVRSSGQSTEIAANFSRR
jgi:hypothetical protein